MNAQLSDHLGIRDPFVRCRSDCGRGVGLWRSENGFWQPHESCHFAVIIATDHGMAIADAYDVRAVRLAGPAVGLHDDSGCVVGMDQIHPAFARQGKGHARKQLMLVRNASRPIESSYSQ